MIADTFYGGSAVLPSVQRPRRSAAAGAYGNAPLRKMLVLRV